jgi:hypothetical protein
VDDLPAVRWHIISCPDWAALYREHPERALSAEDEYARWTREDREEERAVSKVQAMADTDARKAESVQRFKIPDPLED